MGERDIERAVACRAVKRRPRDAAIFIHPHARVDAKARAPRLAMSAQRIRHLAAHLARVPARHASTTAGTVAGAAEHAIAGTSQPGHSRTGALDIRAEALRRLFQLLWRLWLRLKLRYSCLFNALLFLRRRWLDLWRCGRRWRWWELDPNDRWLGRLAYGRRFLQRVKVKPCATRQRDHGDDDQQPVAAEEARVLPVLIVLRQCR